MYGEGGKEIFQMEVRLHVLDLFCNSRFGEGGFSFVCGEGEEGNYFVSCHALGFFRSLVAIETDPTP